jgi:hypothetical protein
MLTLRKRQNLAELNEKIKYLGGCCLQKFKRKNIEEEFLGEEKY